MARFPSTRWSLIRQTGVATSGRAAFGELVRIYHPAILAFFRARLPADAAEDAAQSFLAVSYEHAWWSRADEQHGSFRGFLLVLMRRHLVHLQQARGPASDGSVDPEMLSDGAPDAERQFDLRFVLTLTARAIELQRESYAQRDRQDLFARLLPLLSSPPGHGEIKTIATALGLPANTLTVELTRLRARLRSEMRGLVEDLCADETTFAAEWTAVQNILDGS
jgi:DNA-directed RNA polymerase specialized sigma24 family protein